MSDDEVLRRRAPFAALAAVVGVLALGAWLYGRMQDDVQAFKAFCSATHPGELRDHVQERAAAKGYAFARQGRTGASPEEWLAEAELWGYHAGCVVVVDKGRVVRTRFAELP